MLAKNMLAIYIIALGCFGLLGFAESKLPQEEVDALQQIFHTMGAKLWKFNRDTFEVEKVGVSPDESRRAESTVECDCDYQNRTVCHVTKIVLKGYSLPGMLPPELPKLPFLRELDFANNDLYGTIPQAWASMQLTSISVLANRLSGRIPKELGNITTLTYLCLEANRFSGVVPSELGKLVNLQTLMLSSNLLTGRLPMSFAHLINLTDFRVNDNKFSGPIPDFIQRWKQLNRLEMQASGLEGPIPSTMSVLDNLTNLRISDIKGPSQAFPMLKNMKSMQKLVLRNCNISGKIPSYIWTIKDMKMLDVTFNNLSGQLPSYMGASYLKFIFLSGNSLSGDVPESFLIKGSNIDLSYNNFTWQRPNSPACRSNLNLNLNLYRSSSAVEALRSVLPCMENFKCKRYVNCLHINCGGKDASIKENKQTVMYEGDGDVEGGTAKYFRSNRNSWGFSSTGDFLDDNDFINTRYTASLPSADLSLLDTTARISPLSLTYFHYCLENGNYTMILYFAEIQFTSDNTYRSLGRRVFDIYVQGRLVWKDFDIKKEAGKAQKPTIKQIFNVSVTNNTLEVRLYWAGRGTTRIPERGVYGPLISAISVVSQFKPCPNGSRSGITGIIVGVGVFCLVVLILASVMWKVKFQKVIRRKKDGKGSGLQTGNFKLKQIQAATNNFSSANKIGEGGFGPVYKGQLPDGTVIAVKQLSSISRQGNQEFLNEIGMISCVLHPNLVKLHGFCVEEDQLLLVYEYMENNSLAHALFRFQSRLTLDWSTRLKICVGIARGLAFLHEESTLKIIHRDIKATNVLLDTDLNPKISDFGLARLYEVEKTHVSTRVAGTIGYMAPEYALWGHLSYKVDVYSFGIMTLEIVSGKNNRNYMPEGDFVCILDWACHLLEHGNLMELVDERLGSNVNMKEVEIVVKVGLLCTSSSPAQRPTMSDVVSMLEGQMAMPETIWEPSGYQEDLRFKALRELREEMQNLSSSGSQTQGSTTAHTIGSSPKSSHEVDGVKQYSSDAMVS